MMLAQHGFSVDATIQKNGDDTISSIESICSNGDVKIVDIRLNKPESYGRKRTLQFHDIMENYKPKKVQILWTSYPKDAYIGSHEQKQMLVKCAIHLALSHLVPTTDGVNVCSKPKSVYAKKRFDKGTLKLVPGTLKVDMHQKGTASVVEKAVPIMTDRDQDCECHLIPLSHKTLHEPFWYVASHAETFNSKIQYEEVIVKVGSDNIKVNVPYLTNTKVLTNNAEVVMFQPKVEKPEKEKRISIFK